MNFYAKPTLSGAANIDELATAIRQAEIMGGEVRPADDRCGTWVEIIVCPLGTRDRYQTGLMIEHSDEEMEEIGQRRFAQLCRAIGVSEIEDLEQMMLLPFMVRMREGPCGPREFSDLFTRFFYPDEGPVPVPDADLPPYEHALGDCVDHVGGGMTAIVIGMSRTSSGRELYTVRETRTDKRRQMLGSVLIAAAA